MVHFQVKPAADVHPDEDTGSFDVSRSNSEPGPRPPLPRDKKLEPADQNKQPAAPAKRKFIVLPTKMSDLRAANPVNESETDAASTENDRAKFSPSQKLEGNIFSRALKNFRGRKPSGESGRQNSEEMEFSSTPPLLGGVRGEVSPIQAAARSDSVNTYNNEDTITSYAESDWAAPVMMRKKKSNHAFHNLSRRGSGTSEDVFTYTKQHDGPSTLPEHLKNSLVVILSGIYGILLVVLGLVLPLSETFIKSQQPYFFEMYYLYLYVVSLIFLIYVYTYLLRRERLSLLSFPKTFSRKLRSLSRSSSQRSSMKGSIDKSGSAPPNPSIAGSTMSRRNSIGSTFSTRSRRRKIGFNSETSNHTGSFYLRIGIIGFGIGSMIHSGLTFGHYFEINHLGDPCSDILQAIKPVAHLCFTFVQMYFVFMNSKMCVHKYKTIARFGMMHMCGTNICVWLRSIVVETLHVIDVDKRSKQQDLPVHMTSTHTPAYRDVNNTWLHQGEGHHTDNAMGMLPELDCHWDAMMGRVVEKSSIYLYPCTIEYSLVCACVLYVMWSNVGEDTTARRLMSLESASDDGTSRESVDDVEERSHRMSVDCAGSSRGLFLGILLFVVCVVCLICYYVLKGSPGNLMAAAVLGHITEDIIYLLAMGATAIAAYKMKSMHFSMAREVGMEEILMLISLSGLGMFGIFSIVSSLFYLDTLDGGLTIITNVLMMVQAASQTTFNLAALRVSATHRSQIREKPGREFVTFLLISNFALWAFNTFETQRSDHNRIQVKFYGATAWAIFSHISVPLGIYFRFHSTVSLSNVWKTAWKLKHAQSGGHLQGH
ncbi:proton channel OtopLc-like [Physella acuta]|uniref:proton channel OtopLc-like n=1 Tax=Physella acuta TaxID=109671 RepID=UPI0027DE1614|nr:proton channel OtopLc-like [Physella acuta]